MGKGRPSGRSGPFPPSRQSCSRQYTEAKTARTPDILVGSVNYYALHDAFAFPGVTELAELCREPSPPVKEEGCFCRSYGRVSTAAREWNLESFVPSLVLLARQENSPLLSLYQCSTCHRFWQDRGAEDHARGMARGALRRCPHLGRVRRRAEGVPDEPRLPERARCAVQGRPLARCLFRPRA